MFLRPPIPDDVSRLTCPGSSGLPLPSTSEAATACAITKNS
jgi:hypothetical protein